MRKKNIIKLLKQISYNSQKHKDVIETNKAFVPPWIVFDACQRWSKNIAQFYAQRVTSTISSVVGSTSGHAGAAAAAAVGGGGGGGAHRGTIGDAKSGKTKKHHKTHKIGNNGGNKGLHFQYSFQSSQQSLASVASSTSMTSVTSTGTASTTSQKSHSKIRHNGTRERYYKHHHHRQSRHKRRENREKHGNHGNHGNHGKHGKHMKMGQRRGVRNHGNHHQQLVDRVKSGDSILSVHQYSIQSSQTRSSVSLSSDEDINVDSKMKPEQDSSANSSDCGSHSDSACDSQGNNNNNNNENESEMNESGAGSHSEFHNWQSIMRDFVEYIPFDKMNIHYFDENVLHSGILTKLELNQLDKMRNESNLGNQHNEEKEHSKEWRVNIWQKQARFNQEAKNAASLCGEQYLHKAVFRASKRSLNYIEENYLSLVKINDKNVTLRKDFDSNEYECGDNNGDKDDNKNNMNDKKEDGPCLGLFGMKKSSLMCDNDIRNEMQSIMKSVCDTVFIIGQNGKKYYGIGALFGIENVDVNNFGSKHGPPGHGPPGNGKNVVTWPHVNESTFEYISMLFYGLKPRMMSFNHDIVGTLLFCHNFQLNERLQYSCIKALHILFMRKLKQDNQNGMKYIVNTMQHMMKNGLFEIVFSMLLKNDYNLAKDLFRHENLVNFLSNDVSLVICFLKELCKNDKSEVITSEGKHVFLNSMQLGHRFLICNNKWNKQECSVCYRLFNSDKDDNGEYILKKNGNGFWDLPLLFVKFLLKADRSGLGCNENIQLSEDMIYQSCKLWCQYHHPIGSDWIESMRNEFAPFINFKSMNALYFINKIKPLGIISSEQCFEILEHFIKHPNLFEKNEKKTSSAPAPQAEAALESTIPSTAPPPTAGVVREEARRMEEAKEEEKKEEIKQEGTEKENESVDNIASEKGNENEEESMSVQSGNGMAQGKGKVKKKRRKQKKSNGQAFQSMQSMQTMHGVGPHGVTAHGVVAHGVAHGVTHGGAQGAQQAQQQAFQCISQTYSIQSLQSIQSIQSLQSLQSVQSIDGKGSKRKKSRKGKGNNVVNGVNVVPSQQIVDIMSCRPSTQSVPYYYCNDNLARIEPRPIVIPHSQSINIVSMQQQSGNGQSGNSQNENGMASNNSKKRKKKNRNSRRKGQAYQVENQSNIVIFDKNSIDLTKTMVFDSKGNAINSVHFHK